MTAEPQRPHFGRLIEQLLKPDEQWAKKERDSLAGLVLYTMIFSEAMRASFEAHEQGTELIVHEWASKVRFELKARGREVAFEWDHKRAVEIIYSAVPRSVQPLGKEEIEAPLDFDSTQRSATDLIQRAVRALYAAG